MPSQLHRPLLGNSDWSLEWIRDSSVPTRVRISPPWWYWAGRIWVWGEPIYLWVKSLLRRKQSQDNGNDNHYHDDGIIMHCFKSNLILNFPVWKTNSFTFSSHQSSLVSFAWSSKTLKPFGMWNPEHKVCPHRKSSVNCHQNEKGENGLELLHRHPFPSQNTVSPLSIQPGEWAAAWAGFPFARMGWGVKGWGGGSRGSGRMYTYAWFTMYNRNQHSIVKQLSSNLKKAG